MTVINTNVKSLVAQASLAANNKNLSSAMERLSTGSRINSAKDDAAGLAISSRMTSQVRGLNMAIRNANDGISLAQTAEGAMEETTSMLQRMRELSLQATNGVNNAADRAALDAEVQQLKAEIDRIAGTTTFNGQNILNGSFSAVLQIGDQASQTMALSIGGMTTSDMGATAQGAAVGAARASLSVGGASAVASDYQGVSFNASVNGVSKTVTLPVVSSGSVVAGGAAISAAAVGDDSSVDLTVSGQIGGFDQRIADLSTAANAKILVALNGGTAQEIDISDSDYYVAPARATGGEIVAALQEKLDENSAFQGNNRLIASLTTAGRIKLELASGDAGTISVSNSAGNQALLNVLTGSTSTVTSTNGELVIGGDTVDLSANTSFDVGSNHFDLTAQIQSRGYTASALTVDQFIEVYNATAQVDGVQVSQAVKTSNAGAIAFVGTDPTAPVSSPFSNGSLVTGATIANGASTDWVDAYAGAELGSPTITVSASTNERFEISVDSGTAVNVDIAAQTYRDMAHVATALQAAIEASGAFTGDNAISVSATLDSNLREGLTFTSATGKSISVDGTFLSATTATAGGTASTAFNASTAVSGTVAYDASTGAVAISGANVVSGIGEVFTQRTNDYSAAIDNRFVINVNGSGNINLDLATAISDRGYDETSMTGAMLVNVLNDTFAANGQFVGVNAVTASLTNDGQIALQVAGGPSSGGNPSIVISDGAGTLTNFLTDLTALNGGTTVASLTSDASGRVVLSTVGDKEKFGVTDYVVSNAGLGNNLLTLAIGDRDPISITVSDGQYTNADALVTDINAKIAASGLFTGENAVVASVITNATTGKETLAFTASNGDSVTASGSLILDMRATYVNSSAQTIVVAGAGTAAAAVASDGDDTLSFKFNDVLYTASITASSNTDALVQAAVDAAVDANGNALGAGKVTATRTNTNADLTLDLDRTDPSTATAADRITDVVYSDSGTQTRPAAGTGSTTTVTSSPVYDEGDVFTFSYNGTAYTATLASSGVTAGNDAAALNVAVDAAVDKNGNVLGAGKVTATTDGTSTIALAADLAASYVTNLRYMSAETYAASSTDSVFAGARAASGGVDLSADNNVTVAFTTAGGTSESRTFALGSSASSVSFADYASLLADAANSAFADAGYTFTAAYSNGSLSFAADALDVQTVSLSGTSVADAVGGGVSGVNPTAAADVGRFYSMDDVATAITADLGGDAVASFDSATGEWTFTVATGDTGNTSSISLSGSGLSAIQFGGSLSATGEAGNATASLLSAVAVDTVSNASAAILSIDNAIEYVNGQRAYLGAIQNRLDHTVSNLTSISTNTSASRSRIMDADYGAESANLARSQIIQQAATAMLAQANQSAQSVLSLLQ